MSDPTVSSATDAALSDNWCPDCNQFGHANHRVWLSVQLKRIAYELALEESFVPGGGDNDSALIAEAANYL